MTGPGDSGAARVWLAGDVVRLLDTVDWRTPEEVHLGRQVALPAKVTRAIVEAVQARSKNVNVTLRSRAEVRY